MSRGHVMNVMCEYFLPTTTVVTLFLNSYIVLTSFFSISNKISPSSNMFDGNKFFSQYFFLFVYYVNNVLTLTNINEIYLYTYFFLWQNISLSVHMFFTYLFFPLYKKLWKLKGRNILLFLITPAVIGKKNSNWK